MYFLNVKGALKKVRVSPCRTDDLHFYDRLLIRFSSKFDALTQFHLVGVNFFYSNLFKALKRCRFSSYRTEVFDYCNRFLIRSHSNFDKILTVHSWNPLPFFKGGRGAGGGGGGRTFQKLSHLGEGYQKFCYKVGITLKRRG